MQYEDILYDAADGVARITIDRQNVMNAFRGRTCEELIHALNRAGWDKAIGVIVLAGAGDKAFCTGGDQSAHDGKYDGRGMIGLPVEELQSLIRDVPKPVIARVQGYAIGGGNVLATLCDFTIASEPRTVRPGRAQCRLGRSGLRHRLSRPRGRREEGARDVVPVPPLQRRRRNGDGPRQCGRAARPARRGVSRWCAEIMERSPTAIAIAKRSFNADSENIRGIGGMGMQALSMYYASEESKEGVRAFNEKRKPDFRKYAGA